MMKKIKISKTGGLVLLFLIVSVLFPISKLFIYVKWDTFGKLVTSEAFITASKNSLLVAIISTILSVLIAYILAYTLNRVNIKLKKFFKVVFVLPMLIPSVSHGLGLINLFGNNGIISRYFDFNIIGPVGIIIGSIMYSFPVAFLMLDDGFKYIDNNMYYVSKSLNLNSFQIFKNVTLVYLKKSILSSIFAVFTMIFTDYGVPIAVGGKFNTLPVFLYKEVIGLLDFSKGTMIAMFLLIPAIISFLVDTFVKDYNNENTGNKNYYSSNKVLSIFLKLFVVLITILIFVVLGSFVYYAFIDNVVLNNSFSLKHFEYVFENGIFDYLLNSLVISLFVAIIGTFISYFAAYNTARIKKKMSKLIHLFTIITLAIPGIVLGLAYTICFRGTFIANTFTIIIICNIVHFIASPYLMAYNALLKVNNNYEVVASTLNISKYKIIMDVIIPCTKSTIIEMFSYFFVNSMITISAVTFLYTASTMPISLLINNYEGNMMLGEAAIVSIIILFINLLVKVIGNIIISKDRKKVYVND